MKKIKKGTKKEFKKIITPNEELRNVKESPFSEINTPKNSEIFVQGSDIINEIAYLASGTTMVVRVDKGHSSVPRPHINVDIHSVYLRKGDIVDIKPYEEFYLMNHVVKKDENLPEEIKKVFRDKYLGKLTSALKQIIKKKSSK